MNKEHASALLNTVALQFEGAAINSKNAMNSLDLVSDSKAKANAHEWLYHCTTTDALLSIIANREFWLSNLKCVNDIEEVGRVDRPEYENTYYVSSFTYEDNVLPEHWSEYGSENDGILIGVKKEWFKKDAVFMASNNTKCPELKVFCTRIAACDYASIEQTSNNRITNPFYINSFGFFQVIYDDNLKRRICENCTLVINGISCQGKVLIPEVAGIIKNCFGECSRNGRDAYIKNWESEKEVRLKVGVQQVENLPNGRPMHDSAIMKHTFAPKIAVPLSDKAFNQVRIRFSPSYLDKPRLIKRIGDILPSSEIEIL